MGRFGIVYIVRAESNKHAFTGHWDRGDPPEMLEEGPGWDDVEEAIAWARARAPRVLVRLGDDDDASYFGRRHSAHTIL